MRRSVKRTEALFEILRVLAALMIAYLLIFICIALMVEDPAEGIKLFVLGPFSSLRRFGNLVARAIPYLMTGAGMCFCYASGRFNLAGEGGFMLSGCMAAYFAIMWGGLGIPSALFIPILLIIGALCGALATGITAVLREKLDTNELVVSLMLNYVILYFCNFMLNKVMKDTTISYTASQRIPPIAVLPTLVPKTDIHLGLIIGLALVVLTAVIFYKTPLGLSIRVCGSNPAFARAAGIKMTACLIGAQLLGGAIAGIGGAVEILGIYNRFQWVSLTQYGFDGLIVAVMAHKNPILVPIGAFLLAHMRIGANILNVNSSAPIEFVQVMQAILIILIAAETFLEKQRNLVIYRATFKEIGKEKAA